MADNTPPQPSAPAQPAAQPSAKVVAQKKLDNERHQEMMGLLSAINKTMGDSTGVLTEIKQNQDETESDRDTEAAKEKRAKQEGTVTDDDSKKGKGVFASAMGGAKDLVGTNSKFGLLGKLGLAAAMIPFLDGFITSLIDNVSESLFGKDSDKDGAQKSVIENAVGKGGMYALLGGFFNKRLILPGFFAGAFSEIFKDLEDNRYIKNLNLSKGQLDAIGLAVGGALGLAVPRLLVKTIPGVVKGAAVAMNQGARGVAASQLMAKRAPNATGVTGQTGNRMPKGMKVNSAGRVVSSTTNRFTSVKALEEAMKSQGRGAKLAKYGKFMKFLKGGALGILPSLFDVAMAIYQDKPENEVMKELTGVLGAAGGLAIGSLGGMALGTAIFPGVGTLIGGFLGGTIGAISGEKLIESISGSLLSGKDVPKKKWSRKEERDKQKKIGAMRRAGIADPRAELDKLAKAGGSAPAIGLTPESQANIALKTQAMTTPSGGFIDATTNQISNLLAGGNTSNQTNVGGSSQVFNIINGASNSLSNAPHLPVPQGF